MNDNNSLAKSSNGVLFGLLGVILGGLALTLTVIHFYAGSVENKVEIETSFKDMAYNLFKPKIKKKELKPSFNFKTDKNIKILAGLFACLGIFCAALSHLKEERSNAYLSAVYISIGAIGFQILTHSFVMLVGFILMVFLFTRFNFIKK